MANHVLVALSLAKNFLAKLVIWLNCIANGDNILFQIEPEFPLGYLHHSEITTLVTINTRGQGCNFENLK